MTDQEINEAVAVKLGWIAPTNKQDVHTIRKFPQPFEEFKWHRGEEFASRLPDYCGSIAAAWELVEKMKDTLYFVDVSWIASKFWSCKAWGYLDKEAPRTQAQADTAPMAICLAFLKLDETTKA